MIICYMPFCYGFVNGVIVENWTTVEKYLVNRKVSSCIASRP